MKRWPRFDANTTKRIACADNAEFGQTTVNLTVVDAEGAPLAHVGLETWDQDTASWVLSGTTDTQGQHAVTAAGGVTWRVQDPLTAQKARCSVPVLPKGHEFPTHASADGTTTPGPRRVSTTRELRLGPTRQITVDARDPSGAPLPGVTFAINGSAAVTRTPAPTPTQ